MTKFLRDVRWAIRGGPVCQAPVLATLSPELQQLARWMFANPDEIS